MAKYTGRTNRMFMKTHYFVSAYELQLIEEYYKAQLDDAGVSLNDFKKECNELKKIYKKYEDKETEPLDKLKEAYEKNPLIYYAYMYEKVKDDYKKFPQGLLLSNLNVDIKALIKRAQKFLRGRKQDIKA